MKVPKHVAIIMDGNGRWAHLRGHPRIFGHIRGAKRVKAIVSESARLGIKALTFFAFSTENWDRPDQERLILWKLFKKYLLKEIQHLDRENIRFRLIGERDRLEPDLLQLVTASERRLARNTGLQLTFAISYGGRRDILQATQQFAQDCLQGIRKPLDLNEEKFRDYLWTGELGELSDVDLLIRTSGESRISNFMLWQLSYAELFFSDRLWPDFFPVHFREALQEFSARERRFGRLKTQPLPRLIKSGQSMSQTL